MGAVWLERRICKVSVLLRFFGMPRNVPLLCSSHGSGKLILWSTGPDSVIVATHVQPALARIDGKVSVTTILLAVPSESLLTSI